MDPNESSTKASSRGSTFNFLGLPRRARDNVYQKLLPVPTQLYLFQDPGGPVEVFAPDKPPRWLALLYTNRQITREAAEVLYGANKFSVQDVTDREVVLLRKFLFDIGPVNASFLSHLVISFPVIEGQTGQFQLRQDSLQTLQLLQERCTSLKTLETHVHRNNSEGILPSSRDSDGTLLTQEALSKVHEQFRDIPLLEKVIVRVFDGKPPPEMMELLEGFGWVVLPGTKDRW